MSSSGLSGWALNLMNGVLIREKEERNTQRRGEGRVQMEAEPGVNSYRMKNVGCH